MAGGKYKMRPKVKNKPKVKIKPKDKPDGELITRTITSTVYKFNNNDRQLLKTASSESKCVYNFYIYCYNVYQKYKNVIYSKAVEHCLNNNKDINEYVLSVLPQYYTLYSSINPIIKNNNNILYKYIKTKNLHVYDYNFENIYKALCVECFYLQGLQLHEELDDVYYKVIEKILKSFYYKNFYTVKDQLINHKKLTILDEKFIEHVKKDNPLISNDITFKNSVKDIISYKLSDDRTVIRGFALKIWKICHTKNDNKLTVDLIINIMDKVYETIGAFYEAIKTNPKAKFPKYLKPNECYILPFYKSSRKMVVIRKRKMIRLTITNKQEYVYVKCPKKFTKNKLTLIELSPLYNGFKFKINYKYNKPDKKVELVPSTENSISVDLGFINLMTIYNPKGKQYIIRGNLLNCTNEYYNKRIGEVQSFIEEIKKSNVHNKDLIIASQMAKINNLWIKREHELDKLIMQIVYKFRNMYKDAKVVIIGYNEHWKDKMNLGRTMNRCFGRIPYSKIIKRMREYMPDKMIIEVEESYTSKCDALSFEVIGKHEVYQGKRTDRGLFRSGIKKLINADLNGAINIMRKKIELNEIKGESIFNPIVIKFKGKIKSSLKKISKPALYMARKRVRRRFHIKTKLLRKDGNEKIKRNTLRLKKMILKEFRKRKTICKNIIP
jgi:putative transposase